MRWRVLGLGALLALALLEARSLFVEMEERWLVAAAVGAGAVAALLAVRFLRPRVGLVAACVALVVPWPFFVVLLVLWATTGGTPFEWVAHLLRVFQLGLPVGAAALAAVRLVELLPLRVSHAGVFGVLAGVALSAIFVVPGAAWRDEPPPSRYATIDDRRGAYGPVALGDSQDDVFVGFGRKAPAGFNESMTPLGADEFEGPTFIPIEAWHDVYRYEDVVFWFDADGVRGFEITSPGALTSRGIEVGDDLNEVREAYPELECGEAPAGDIGTYPYCSGRIGSERWAWFGGDPVSTITLSSRGFEGAGGPPMLSPISRSAPSLSNERSSESS
jgi:hypothetical protein